MTTDTIIPATGRVAALRNAGLLRVVLTADAVVTAANGLVYLASAAPSTGARPARGAPAQDRRFPAALRGGRRRRLRRARRSPCAAADRALERAQKPRIPGASAHREAVVTWSADHALRLYAESRTSALAYRPDCGLARCAPVAAPATRIDTPVAGQAAHGRSRLSQDAGGC
jgi:hypothetical protein